MNHTRKCEKLLTSELSPDLNDLKKYWHIINLATAILYICFICLRLYVVYYLLITFSDKTSDKLRGFNSKYNNEID